MNARNRLHRSNKARLAVEPLENRLAPAIYLNYNTIPGESMQQPENYIELMSFSFGVVRTPTQDSGAGQRSSTSLIDLTIIRKTDVASTDLFLKCCTGQHIPEAVLTTPKADAPQEYMKIEFEQVYISSVRPGGGGGSEFPLEELSINYTKFKFDYQYEKGQKSGSSWHLPQDEEEKPTPPKDDKGSRAAPKGDFTGDGRPDVLAVWNPLDVNPGSTPPGVWSLASFNGFAGGVSVATGDVNGDGRDDVITGAASLRYHHWRWTDFAGGVHVAVGDVNADGFDDVIVGSQPYVPAPSALWAKHSEDTPGLQAAPNGQQAKPVKIEFCQPSDQRSNYLQLELENCLVSSFSLGGSSDLPMESLSLNFTRIK